MYDFPHLAWTAMHFLEKVHCSSSKAERHPVQQQQYSPDRFRWGAKSTQNVEPAEGWFHAIEFCTFLGTNISRPKGCIWFADFPSSHSEWRIWRPMSPTCLFSTQRGKWTWKFHLPTSTHGGGCDFSKWQTPQLNTTKEHPECPELTDIYQKNYTPVN